MDADGEKQNKENLLNKNVNLLVRTTKKNFIWRWCRCLLLLLLLVVAAVLLYFTFYCARCGCVVRIAYISTTNAVVSESLCS